MKTDVSVVLAAVAALAGAAPAQFEFGGRDWFANWGFHRDCPLLSEYAPADLDADGSYESCLVTGVFADTPFSDTAMVTMFHVIPGDVVSYDITMPEVPADRCGDGYSTWFTDTFASFATSPFGDGYIGPLNFEHIRVVPRIGWASWGGRALLLIEDDERGTSQVVGIDVTQGVHFEWHFVDETSYRIEVYDAAGNLLLGRPGTIYAAYTLADVDGFRVGLWDSEQTLTISNFEIGREEECVPDLDGNGVLNVFDFLAFQTLFSNGC